MIISTRESKAVREKVIRLGVSQISGASRTSVGGYCEPEPEDESSEQFDVSDKRTLDEVVRWLMEMGYIPSFCTACYREEMCIRDREPQGNGNLRRIEQLGGHGDDTVYQIRFDDVFPDVSLSAGLGGERAVGQHHAHAAVWRQVCLLYTSRCV